MARKFATWFRDTKRRRFADRYHRENGDAFQAYGMDLTVPQIVDPNVRYILAKGRPYESEEAHYIQQVLTTGQSVIELGGSLGVISRVIRRAIGPDAHHTVVEANPDLAPICAGNAMRGATLGATVLHQAAVAYTDQPTIAFQRGETAHTGQLAQDCDANTFEAPAKRLSDLVAELPDGPFTLVSDIEGGEYPMFMEEPAETFARVSHAIIEIHPKVFALMGGTEQAFFDAATAKGFTLIERRADVVLMKGPTTS